VRSTSDVELPDDVTVDVWMYWDGPTAVAWQWILAHGDDVRDMTLEVRSADRYFAFSDAYTYASDTTPLASGRWVHVAATYATGSGASTLWIDGALADTGTDRLIPFASRPLNIGGTGAYPTARPFDGTIHSVWIRRGIQYTTAFAPALPEPTMDTELLWRLGDATAGVVTDAAGSGSDATVSNATVVEGCPEP
jgi:hypothetical protein